jgi:hypothetical protein
MPTMDKLIANLDVCVCKDYVKKYHNIIRKSGYSISVLLKSIDNVSALYNAVCMHPDLTEDILFSIIKKSDRKTLYLQRCWLITQEFCEKYKSEFTLSRSEMISNHLPVKYIVEIHGNVLDNLDYYNISKYCTESEYNEYCKPFGNISPNLDNPNMTLDWYMSGYALNDIYWSECVSIRPDLFTPDIIMKYKDYIVCGDRVWYTYFKKFPIAFIEQNLDINYTHYTEMYNCIIIFKNHPGGISWNVIDKYISYHINELKSNIIHLDIPDTVTDLPCWFVKKYIDLITLTQYHMNTHVTYKFIAKNIALIDVGYADMIKIREKYISMLHDVICVFDKLDVNPDLYDTILEYC